MHYRVPGNLNLSSNRSGAWGSLHGGSLAVTLYCLGLQERLGNIATSRFIDYVGIYSTYFCFFAFLPDCGGGGSGFARLVINPPSRLNRSRKLLQILSMAYQMGMIKVSLFRIC